MVKHANAHKQDHAPNKKEVFTMTDYNAEQHYHDLVKAFHAHPPPHAPVGGPPPTIIGSFSRTTNAGIVTTVIASKQGDACWLDHAESMVATRKRVRDADSDDEDSDVEIIEQEARAKGNQKKKAKGGQAKKRASASRGPKIVELEKTPNLGETSAGRGARYEARNKNKDGGVRVKREDTDLSLDSLCMGVDDLDVYSKIDAGESTVPHSHIVVESDADDRSR